MILTHANLLANIRAMGQVARDDVARNLRELAAAVPRYGSDRRLYGQPVLCLSPGVDVAPGVSRPAAALAVGDSPASRHDLGGTELCYELCLRRIDDLDIEGLDLSSWQMALNGAEPISPETVTRFCERFAKYGFRPQTMTPVYGLAESSLGAAFPPPGRGVRIDRIRAIPSPVQGKLSLPTRMARRPCGSCPADARCGHQIRIVDATGYEVAERQVGHLQFQGPSATSGYFRNPEDTRRLFDGDWLNSGDLAYIAGGDLYVTGRFKNLIIRAGRNIYPGA